MVEGGYNRIFIVEGHFPLQSPPMGRQYVDHSTTFSPMCSPGGRGWGVGHIIDSCIIIMTETSCLCP